MSKLNACLLAMLAYFIWGLSPLYFKSIQSLPASEIIIHRIIWSAVGCMILLAFIKQKQWWKPLLEKPKYLLILICTGVMLSGNWLLYVWAINSGYMLETSLGYYINPLLSVFLGMVVLKERLRLFQWIAIGLALIGVMIQIILLGKLPWISLLLGLSFAIYGLVRKIVPIKVLPGMCVETWVLVPIALCWLWLHPSAVTLQSEFWHSNLWWLAIFAGPLTLIPLILFNIAAKNLPYSTIGFLQYISPTLVFLLAVFYFGEALNFYTMLTFGFIWVALVFFSLDSYIMRKRYSFLMKDK
ncbi:EamA family transporter RarD [Zophobihabitans entericus]|uniref:EamA family transporter RarD n=1 Tax=Zophobihabitans entericus TaxID=1635327 RepID=A0A6G9IDZ6_9GAMM|nr:EamA family transporter RarD [Zophobihabitans entericus]QIQ22042.1 EamA family transporter RarD [Zophobihabitans entericus]